MEGSWAGRAAAVDEAQSGWSWEEIRSEARPWRERTHTQTDTHTNRLAQKQQGDRTGGAARLWQDGFTSIQVFLQTISANEKCFPSGLSARKSFYSKSKRPFTFFNPTYPVNTRGAIRGHNGLLVSAICFPLLYFKNIHLRSTQIHAYWYHIYWCLPINRQYQKRLSNMAIYLMSCEI